MLYKLKHSCVKRLNGRPMEDCIYRVEIERDHIRHGLIYFINTFDRSVISYGWVKSTDVVEYTGEIL